MVPSLDGPRLIPSGPAKQLVVFVHGCNAYGKDLIAIGEQWRHFLPETAFVAPNGPEVCAEQPAGHQWFTLTFGGDKNLRDEWALWPGAGGAAPGPDQFDDWFALSRRDEDELWPGVNDAQPGFDKFLDAELARYGLSDDRLALVGFSQGAILALHVGLRRGRAPAAIVAYSGLLAGPERLANAQAKHAKGGRPPILLVHGDQDDLLPLEAMFITAEHLADANIPAQWHLARGLRHGIDESGLRHGGLFLAKSFGLKPDLSSASAGRMV